MRGALLRVARRDAGRGQARRHRPRHAERLHVDQGLECVRAGVPALIEKPIAHSLAEGVRLCDAAERAGVKLLVGHHRRHSPILHKVCEIVNSGMLGRLVGVIGSAVFYKPDEAISTPQPWRRQPGGGPILINMIHEVGQPARDGRRDRRGAGVRLQRDAGSSVEDTVAINLRFANGALGTFLLSDTGGSARSWEQTSQENKSYATYPDEDCLHDRRHRRIARRADDAAQALREQGRPVVVEAVRAPARCRVARTDPLEVQIEHFAAVIRGEQEPLVTCRDGLQNLRVTDAIVEAARTGCAVQTI